MSREVKYIGMDVHKERATRWMRASWLIYCARECCDRSITENMDCGCCASGAQLSDDQQRSEPGGPLTGSVSARRLSGLGID